MLLRNSLIVYTSLVAAGLVSGTTAGADTFDSTDAGALLSNTIPDLDLFFLTQFVGAFPGQPQSYNATISPTGFSESLTGTYGGSSLDVAYTGSVEQVAPSGTILGWSSVGVYGSAAESSTGVVTFEYMGNPGVFDEYYQETFTVGSNIASADLTISGINNSGVYTYTDSSGDIF
jgi:hypothetical protein